MIGPKKPIFMEIAILKQYMGVFIIFTSCYILLLQYYDIRKKCEGSLCYDFSNMEKFLNQESVRDSLGVGKIRFFSCSTEVYMTMLVDWMRNLEVGIPILLEDGIDLLVYVGEYDLICNWLGKYSHLIYLRFVEKFNISYYNLLNNEVMDIFLMVWFQ